jgi:peptidoglycan/xylan/chitin deacetylase (PgdA/CDA1 family)
MKLRNVLKAATAGALVGTGLYHVVRRIGRPRIHVVGYHRVVDRVIDDGPVSPSLCVSTETFRNQMRQVKRDFRVLSLEEAMAAICGDLELDRDACAVTFDDGYRDVYTRAAPILAELKIPAAVFVPSGYVGTRRHLTHDRLYAALWKLGKQRLDHSPAELVDALIARMPASALTELASDLEARAGGAPRLDDDARVLDRKELRALADAGWEIGAHTIEHVVVVHEPPERVEDELLLPKIDLESWTGRPCRYFAYCNGFHSPSVVKTLERLGYQGAVTTYDRPNRRGGDRFRVGRKVLWEGHARGLDGKWSPSVSAANLHDLFGALKLTRPVDGECEEVTCAQM